MTAKIYLASNRGKHELPWFRSFHMFNFGSYYSEFRSAPGNLYVFNEDTLAGGKQFTVTVEEESQILLIPLVGVVGCNKQCTAPGEALLINAFPGEELDFSNPYEQEEDLVNFLQVWFKNNTIRNAATQLFPFSLETNGLTQDIITDGQYPPLSIGKFRGREKGVYRSKAGCHGLFVFVIDGVFEVEDRLLHARDGLELKGIDSIEFEALSEDAILLITGIDIGC